MKLIDAPFFLALLYQQSLLVEDLKNSKKVKKLNSSSVAI